MKGTIKKRWGQYFISPSSIFDTDSSLSAYALLVYLFLCRTADYDTKASFPSQKTIAKKCRIAVSTVKEALNQLKSAGLLTVESRPGSTNVYIIEDPQAPAVPSINETDEVAATRLGGSRHAARGVAATRLGGSRETAIEQHSPNNTHTTTPITENSAPSSEEHLSKAVTQSQIDVVVAKYEEVTKRSDLTAKVAVQWIERFGIEAVLECIESIKHYRRKIENPIGFLVVQLASRDNGTWVDSAEEQKKANEKLRQKTQEYLARVREWEQKAQVSIPDWRAALAGELKL